MKQPVIPEPATSMLGGFHDAIYAHFRGLPGVENVLQSLRDAATKIDQDADLRGAKIFIQYNTSPESRYVPGSVSSSASLSSQTRL